MTYRFHAMPIRITADFFVEIDKLIPKFLWKGKLPEANTILKTTQRWRTTLPNFETSYEAIAWYCHKDRHVDPWNTSESQEINSYIYGQLIFNNGAKTTEWRRNGLFNKWC